jgi:hypothetical protein
METVHNTHLDTFIKTMDAIVNDGENAHGTVGERSEAMCKQSQTMAICSIADSLKDIRDVLVRKNSN